MGIGSQFRNLALPLITLAVSGDLAQAGIMAAVTTLIRVILGPIGGVVLDRIDRRAALYIYAIVSTLTWGTVSILIVTGHISLLALWGASIIAAINGSILGSASDAALLSIVQGGTYAKAMAANQGRDAVLGLAAPPLGGMLYGLTQVAPFAASALFSAIVMPAVKGIKVDLRPHPAERPGLIRELIDGFHYSWSNTERKTLMIMAMFINTFSAFLLGGITFWMMNTGTSAFMIGLAEAIASGAMFLGALLAPRLMDKVRPGPTVVAALLWFAAAFALTVVFPGYWGLVTGQALAVLPLPLMNSLVMGYYFAKVRISMQGRVQSVLGVATGGLAALPPALLGFLLPEYGYRPIALIALIGLGIGAITFGLTRTARDMPRLAEWPKPDE